MWAKDPGATNSVKKTSPQWLQKFGPLNHNSVICQQTTRQQIKFQYKSSNTLYAELIYI